MLWNEEMIRAELCRMDEITGLCSRDIPIRFNASKCCLGSFCVADGKPKAFNFSIRFFMDESFAQKEGVNVIRHEYAHFMEHAIYGGIERGKPHGPRWKECCAYLMEYQGVLCGNFGGFTGRKLPLKEFIAECRPMGLSIMTEGYSDVTMNFSGFRTARNTCYEFFVEISYAGEIIFHEKE